MRVQFQYRCAIEDAVVVACTRAWWPTRLLHSALSNAIILSRAYPPPTWLQRVLRG